MRSHVKPAPTYDLVVLGGGSGGVRAANRAAQAGATVALVEEKRLGGTCVNVGCMPKKVFMYASHFSHECELAQDFGWDVTPSLQWERLVQNTASMISRLNTFYQNSLTSNGVHLYTEHATLRAPDVVEVGEQRLTARHVLIATGGRPTLPPLPGIQNVITSDDIFSLPKKPATALVVGGGYISMECSSILSRFGVRTVHIHRNDHLLRGFDREIVSFLMERLKEEGLDLRLNTEVTSLERTPQGVLAHGPSFSFEAECVLFAIGRRPHTEGLGLEALGIKTNAFGALDVDSSFRTSVPTIYAVGDVVAHRPLTPVAIEEAEVVVARLFGNESKKMEYRFIPSAMFSQPPVGTVGLTEEEAHQRYPHVDVYTSVFTDTKNTLSPLKRTTMLKLVVDKDTDHVLGAHMVGEGAGEITQLLAIALVAGAKKADFDSTTALHPTLAEEFVSLRTSRPSHAPQK